MSPTGVEDMNRTGEVPSEIEGRMMMKGKPDQNLGHRNREQLIDITTWPMK